MLNGRSIRVMRLAAGVGLCLLGVVLSGCYEKVTRAEGFGADRITTEEPNRRQGPVDELIFGKDRPAVRSDSGPVRK